MDRFALVAANLLVGNAPDAGCLEMVVRGPNLVAESTCLVAITGGDLQPRINGHVVAGWTSIALNPGDRLKFGMRRMGSRAYLAVAGGFDGEKWLSSVSTYPLVGRGGIAGRTLKAADLLSFAAEPRTPLVSRHLPEHLRPSYAGSDVANLSALPGPHFNRLASESQNRFFMQEYMVTPNSDRMGYRLVGDTLDVQGRELLSFGLTYGCVQVPRSGQPILLMADHQTTGGYAVVAVVIRSDLPVAAQLLPGARIRFRRTTLRVAELRRQALKRALQTLAPGQL